VNDLLSQRPAVPDALVLVRHGESTGNLADARAHSSGAEIVEIPERDADVPLSPLGRRQAEAVGRSLAQDPPDVLLASPYLRARSTAQAIADALPERGSDVGIRTDERLRERDLGWWDGLTGAGVRARFPEEYERRRRIGKFYYRPPGGESWCDVALRVRSVLSSLGSELAGRRVLLVSHQAVIMNFRLVLEGLDEEAVLRLDAQDPLANCSVTSYRAGAGGLELLRAGDVSAVSDVKVTDDPTDDEPLDERAG